MAPSPPDWFNSVRNFLSERLPSASASSGSVTPSAPPKQQAETQLPKQQRGETEKKTGNSNSNFSKSPVKKGKAPKASVPKFKAGATTPNNKPKASPRPRNKVTPQPVPPNRKRSRVSTTDMPRDRPPPYKSLVPKKKKKKPKTGTERILKLMIQYKLATSLASLTLVAALAGALVLGLVVFRAATEAGLLKPPTPEKANMVGLGRSFYLPHTQLLGDIGAGATIFKKVHGSCFQARNSSIDKVERTSYESTESLMSKIGTETGLEGKVVSGYTLGASVDAATNNVDKEEMSVKGISVDAYSFNQYWEFNQDCLIKADLTYEFRIAFENLPAMVVQPHKRRSWEEYNIFLQKFGSHIATRITHGSRVTRYVFSKSTEKIKQSDFNIKVCADLQYAAAYGNLCQGYTQEDYSRVSDFQTQSTTTVRGGSDNIRAELAVNLNDTLLKQFLKESDLLEQAVSYQYQSVWEMLKGRYLHTEHFARAINLEAYFLGYLNAECSHIDNGGNVDLRRFEQVGVHPGHPEYACKLAPIGCRVDRDCNSGSLFTCHCYGESCVEKLEQEGPKHSVKESRRVKKEYDEDQDKDSGSNQSCSGILGLTGCFCDQSFGKIWKVVWSSDNPRKSRRHY